MITGITHLALTVKDMEKSLDFYTRGLGYQKAFELPEPRTGAPWIVYLKAGSQFIELFYNATDDNPWKPRLRGFNHIALQVDDIQTTVKSIEAAGIKMDQAPKQGADKNWQAWLTDPDGVRIELMQLDPESPQGKLIAGRSL
jgi:lactoylglutathione lyase